MGNRFEEIEKRLDWWESRQWGFTRMTLPQDAASLIVADIREIIAKLKKQHQDNLIENGK